MLEGAALQQGKSSIPCCSADWRSLRLEPSRDNATPRRLSLSDLVLDDYLPEEPPLDPLLEPLLEEPPVDEPLPDPDESPVPNELPDDPLLEGLVEEDPPEDDFSVDELRPEEEAPLPEELLSLLEEAPLDDEPFPLPEASTPSALAVLSSSRPVACIPLSF